VLNDLALGPIQTASLPPWVGIAADAFGPVVDQSRRTDSRKGARAPHDSMAGANLAFHYQ